MFYVTFAYKFCPTKIMKTFFGMTSEKTSSSVFLQTLGAFFQIKQRWVPFLPGFSGILTRFLGILPGFSEILTRFSGIFPGFSTNQSFWGCSCIPCTPASYTTVIDTPPTEKAASTLLSNKRASLLLVNFRKT